MKSTDIKDVNYIVSSLRRQ